MSPEKSLPVLSPFPSAHSLKHRKGSERDGALQSVPPGGTSVKSRLLKETWPFLSTCAAAYWLGVPVTERPVFSQKCPFPGAVAPLPLPPLPPADARSG